MFENQLLRERKLSSQPKENLVVVVSDVLDTLVLEPREAGPKLLGERTRFLSTT